MDMSRLLQIIMAHGVSLGNRYRWANQLEVSQEMTDRFEQLANKEFLYVD